MCAHQNEKSFFHSLFQYKSVRLHEVSQNFNLIGQMYYSFSTIACIPASKSQDVGMALGAQAGLGKLTSILNQGGFSKVEMTYKTASNMVIEARI